ncbi:hypothetical protein G6F66_014332 [Rhizopus arrhizus]|nr:hypothetical protein G6F66_014332 [Rhizopus arrhizus]
MSASRLKRASAYAPRGGNLLGVEAVGTARIGNEAIEVVGLAQRAVAIGRGAQRVIRVVALCVRVPLLVPARQQPAALAQAGEGVAQVTRFADEGHAVAVTGAVVDEAPARGKRQPVPRLPLQRGDDAGFAARARAQVAVVVVVHRQHR